MKSGWADTVLSEMYMSYCGVPTKPQPLTQWGRYTFIHASCGFLLTFQKKHLVFWLLCQTGWPPTLSVCQFESRHSLRKQLLSRSLSAVHSQVAVHLWRVVICGRIWWSVPVDHVGPWKTHVWQCISSYCGTLEKTLFRLLVLGRTRRVALFQISSLPFRFSRVCADVRPTLLITFTCEPWLQSRHLHVIGGMCPQLHPLIVFLLLPPTPPLSTEIHVIKKSTMKTIRFHNVCQKQQVRSLRSREF